MAKKYLDYEGLSHFWSEIKGLFVKDINYNSSTHQITKTIGSTTGNVVAIPYKTSELTNDSGYITSADVPEGSTASTVTPKMDGTAALGTDNGFARGDHVHPTDTSRVPTTRTVNGKALSSNITLTGSDIAVSSSDSTKIATVLGTTLDTISIIDDVGENINLTSEQYHIEILGGTGIDVTAHPLSAGESGTPYLTISTNGQPNVLEGVQMNGTDLTITNKKVNVPVFTGATSSAAGSVGLVPAPASATMSNVLTGDGSWKGLCAGTSYGSDYVTPKIGVGTSASVGSNINAATSSTAGVMSASDKSKLDSITMTNGVIDSSVLPSFVDDVVEAYARSNQTELGSTWLATGSASGTVITPETGKIYVLINDSTSYSANSQFRWGGTAYVKLSDGGVSSITNSEIDTILAS